MARGVGVEISDQRVRVACVEHSAKRVRLVSFHEQAIPRQENQAWEDAAAEALKHALAATKAPRGRLTASLDSGDAVLRELSLPFKGDDQIKKTFRFELESLIHNYTIEELVADFFKVSELEKGTAILAAAVPKKVIERHLQVFQKAGLDPEALDLDVTALFNALVHVGAIDTDEPFLVVYGTAKFTKILLVEKKRPRSIRTIRFSFPTAQEAEREQAERKQHREWQTQDLDKPAPIVILTDDDHEKFADLDLEQRTSLIEILAKEISRFLLASAAAATPGHILLAGDYEVDEAAQMLEAGTGIPVKPLAILGRIDHPFSKSDAEAQGTRAPVAVGLALKALGIDELGLDFRRDQYSYSKKYEVLKTTALVTLELVIVFLAAIALNLFYTTRDRNNAYDELMTGDRGFSVLYQEATNEPIETPEDAYDSLAAKLSELKIKVGTGDHPIERSALDLTGQFFRSVQQFQNDFQKRKLGDQEVYYLIDTFKVSQDVAGSGDPVRLEVRGTIRSIAYADALIQQIRRTAPFDDPAWEIPTPAYAVTKDDMRQFTLNITRKRKK